MRETVLDLGSTSNIIMKNKKMKKKILEVNGCGRRMVYQNSSGSFHTTHKQEDIEKWLKHKNDNSYCGGDISVNDFERLFNTDDWYVDVVDESVEDLNVDFNESHLNEDLNQDFDEDELKNICKFDDVIQTFLDEEKQKHILKLKEELELLQSSIL